MVARTPSRLIQPYGAAASEGASLDAKPSGGTGPDERRHAFATGARKAGALSDRRAAGGYVELHAHSSHSLLDGVSSPEALVERAAQLDMPALALTDHDAVYGAVRFMLAAQEARRCCDAITW